MADHRACIRSGLVAAVASAGATAVAVTGLALAGAGTASADGGEPIHHLAGGPAKAVEHIVADKGANVHDALVGATSGAGSFIGALGKDVESLFGGLPKSPLGSALTVAVTHPINTRSLQQIQALETKDANLAVIINQAHVDNNNSLAAQEELAQEREILVKANTLAEGIQNGTISNTQEKQVLIYIGQAQALQAEAKARYRNNIN